MKKIIFIIFSLVISLLFCPETVFSTASQNNVATFDYFSYSGKDERFFNRKIKKEKEYFNPIFSGFSPNPDICRKGEDYFMVHASYSYYPGIPVFHSKDLVHWTQLGYALNNPSQLNLNSQDISSGITSVSIDYDPATDIFYLSATFTNGSGNFYITTDNPFSGNWSGPVLLPQTQGSDLSFFFDSNGESFILAAEEPTGKPAYKGHRAIWIYPFDTGSGRITGRKKLLLDGNADKDNPLQYIGAPRLYEYNGKYYLLVSEGGTGENHAAFALEANQATGPFNPYNENPVLTQRDLPDIRPDRVTGTGRVSLVETAGNEWFAVFSGCRPYSGNHHHTGNETFLLPVSWDTGFPVVLGTGRAIPVVVKKKELSPIPHTLTGNFTWRDDFSGDRPDAKWRFIRTPQEKWWDIKDGKLYLQTIEKSITQKGNPAFMGIRQQHIIFNVETEMDFRPSSDKDFAGIACFQDETHYFIFGKTLSEEANIIVLERAENNRERLAETIIPESYSNLPVRLRIKGVNDKYSFYVSYDNGKTWISVFSGSDARNLSTEYTESGRGTIVGVYATSNL